MNSKEIKKLNKWDFILLGFGVFFFALAIATYWPILVNRKYQSLWITLVILAAIKPIYVIWFKKKSKDSNVKNNL